MPSILKRHRIRRGSNASRLGQMLYDGEIFYVKDWAAAGVSPLWIGNGSTAGGVDHLTGYYVKKSDVSVGATANAIAQRNAAGQLAGDITGNAATATSATNATSATTAARLASAKTIQLTGAVSGTVNTDLSSNVTINTSLSSALSGGIIYQSDYNAATNSPALPAASPSNKGYAYRVSVAGGIYMVGDFVVSNGTSWDKWDNTDPTAAEIFAQIDDIDGGEV